MHTFRENIIPETLRIKIYLIFLSEKEIIWQISSWIKSFFECPTYLYTNVFKILVEIQSQIYNV